MGAGWRVEGGGWRVEGGGSLAAGHLAIGIFQMAHEALRINYRRTFDLFALCGAAMLHRLKISRQVGGDLHILTLVLRDQIRRANVAEQ
jgi:hypothetical protein